jgi:hypothetical protein
MLCIAVRHDSSPNSSSTMDVSGTRGIRAITQSDSQTLRFGNMDAGEHVRAPPTAIILTRIRRQMTLLDALSEVKENFMLRRRDTGRFGGEAGWRA